MICLKHYYASVAKMKIWLVSFSVLNAGGTGVLWWLYAKQRKFPSDTLNTITVDQLQLQIAKDNRQALLIYAIAATVFTVSI